MIRSARKFSASSARLNCPARLRWDQSVIAYAFGLKADDGDDFLLYASTEIKEAIAFLTVLGG